MNNKNQKIKTVIPELAANFSSRISNRQESLITVTNVEIESKGGKAIILISVLPAEKEKVALEFANRQLSDFRKYVDENSRLSRIPYFEVRLDVGEKNRQLIDEISKKI